MIGAVTYERISCPPTVVHAAAKAFCSALPYRSRPVFSVVVRAPVSLVDEVMQRDEVAADHAQSVHLALETQVLRAVVVDDRIGGGLAVVETAQREAAEGGDVSAGAGQHRARLRGLGLGRERARGGGQCGGSRDDGNPATSDRGTPPEQADVTIEQSQDGGPLNPLPGRGRE